ncbi:MAG: protein kinase, partial [Planctomycetaceae bacterium]|nr:protein kinase [Planctomycetaceae bacterium]
IDFGVAKATEQKLTERTLFTQYGTMVGTLEYMSPEQAEMSALGVDTRSDIYSLGVLLYELLTGNTPLSHKTMKEAAYAEILRLIKEEEPPKPSTRLSESGEALASISANRHTEPAKLTKLVRGELDWIVMKTLEKDRGRRYETANGFAADVLRYLNDEPVQACPPSASYRLRKFARRNRVAMMTTGLVALALLAGTVVSAWQAIRATQARHDAELARTDEAAQRAVADRRRIEADGQREEAVSQRRKAEEARKEAITNLQKAREAGHEFFTRVSENRLLEEPGLQPLRKELLEAAVAYYEGLATGKSEDPQAQADLIASRLRLIQVYYHTGSTNQKMAALEQGIELVEEFLRAHPDATIEHQQLAGFFHGGRGTGDKNQPLPDLDLALRVYQRAAALWEKLVERYPTTTGFQSDLSKFYDLQGGTQLKMGKRDDALRTRQKVREIREQIVHANPGVYEHVAELGYAYQSLAALLEASDPAAAEAWYRQSITIQKVAPDIVTYQDFLATHRACFGRFLGKRKRPDEAIQLLQESLGIWEKLARGYPNESKFSTKAEALRREIKELLAEMEAKNK